MHPTSPTSENELDDAPLEINGNSFHLRLAILFSCIGGFLFGYDTGIISGAMLLIESEFNLSDFKQEIIVTVTILGAWLFSLVSSYVADFLGRKKIILISSVVFTIGSLTMGFANSTGLLIAGRFILGMAIGFSSSTVPVYIAEIVQYHQRGTLVATYNVLITAGQFGAGLIAGLFSTVNGGWRYMIIVGAIPSALQALYFLFAYESPRYLLKIGKEDEAYRSLRNFRRDEALAQIEFEQIKLHVKGQEEESQKIGNAGVLDVIKRTWSDLPLRRAVVLGCSLQLIQQFAGINTIMYYSATIIEQAGVEDKSQAIWYSCLTGLVNFILTTIGLLFIERVGRRKMLLVSCAGTCLSLLFLSGSFYLARSTAPMVTDVADLNSTCSAIQSCISCVKVRECGFCFTKGEDQFRSTCLPVDRKDLKHSLGGWCSADHNETLLTADESFLSLLGDNETSPNDNRTQFTDHLKFAPNTCPSDYSYLIILGLILYLVAFACGLGPIVWVVNSEIYPLNFRTGCFSLSVAFNWSSNTLVSLTFLSLIGALTETGTFLIYLFFSLVGLIYFSFSLPETKGKTLEEIDKLFQRPGDKPVGLEPSSFEED